MKRRSALCFVFLSILLVSGINRCQKYDDLSDQNPMLVVDVQILNQGVNPIDDAHKIYLIYFNSSDWTEPWLIQGTTGTQFFNPVVLSFNSVYLAVFYDANGNGTVDPGEPCIGFDNVNHSSAVPPPSLTQIQFLPLEIKRINMTLDFGAGGPKY
jgi:hypothetical protein